MKIKSRKTKQTKNKKLIIKETEELARQETSIKRTKRKIKNNNDNLEGMDDEIV
jgi:hypothetical protein